MSATLKLDIGGIILHFALPHADWLDPLVHRYEAFLTGSAPDWSINVTAGDVPVTESEAWIDHVGPVTRFAVPGVSGMIDLEARRAAIQTPLSSSRVWSAVERTAGYILMQALPRERKALWLHASGVVLDGQGHVFFGPSGAGKTTVARLAAGHADVLCDENVIVMLGAAGPELLSTPFWGHSTPPDLIHRVNRRVPLAALYTLAHAPDFSLTRLGPAEAVTALLNTEKVATERVESADAWLNIAGQIAIAAPLSRLGFRPTAELWRFLAGWSH